MTTKVVLPKPVIKATAVVINPDDPRHSRYKEWLAAQTAATKSEDK